MPAQLEAAFSFFSAAGQEDIKLNEFEDKCGVGMIILLFIQLDPLVECTLIVGFSPWFYAMC